MDGIDHYQQIDAIHSSNHTQVLSHELNKKRKLQQDLADSISPLTKQKIHNQELMEQEQGEEELSENNTNVSSFFKSETNNSSVNQDCPSSSTSSNSYTTNDISSNNYCNSIDSGVNYSGNYELNMVYECKKSGYDQIEGLDDPILAELIMKNGIEGCDFLYSNELNEFTMPPDIQGGKEDKREPTIDKEFEQYFSSLML